MTAPDPTAGERAKCWRGECRAACYYPAVCSERPASPPAVAASTGTSEDVEGQRRALEDWLIDNRWALEAYDFSHALMASDWLAAQKAAARAEERERIAQAIEARKATFVLGGALDACACRVLDLAARIAREVRP